MAVGRGRFDSFLSSEQFEVAMWQPPVFLALTTFTFCIGLPLAGFGAPLTVLHPFGPAPTDGITPETSLLPVGDYLYVTAGFRGTFGYGVAFRMRRDGSGYELLHHFTNGPDGYGPNGNFVTDGTFL